MPYTPHTYVTFGGRLRAVAGEDEIWQCGVRGMNVGDIPVDQGQLQNLVEAIVTQTSSLPNLPTWFEGDTNGMPIGTTLDWCKAANIGADGRYTGDPAIYMLEIPALGDTISSVPSFLSVVYSWTTARRSGRRLRYGRVYPPNYGYPIAAQTATIPVGQQTQARNGAQELLHALARSGEEYGFIPCVVSPSGGFEPITGVRVGNLYDVHRSRKNAVPETYVVGDFPA